MRRPGRLFQAFCNRRTLFSLLQGRILPIVNNPVQHPIVILHSHLCIFQRIVHGDEAVQLLKTNVVHIMRGDFSVDLQPNHITDGHTVALKIRRMVYIELRVQSVQAFRTPFPTRRQRAGIDCSVILPIHRNACLLQLLDGLKQQFCRFLLIFQLVDDIGII